MSEKVKNNLILFGNSHAKRLFYCLNSNDKILKEYKIYNYAKPGTTFSELILPPFRLLTKNSVLIIICYGNDLFDKSFVHTTVDKKGNRIFHLTKFAPNDPRKLHESYEALGKWLKTLECKVLLLDNVYRHVCCEKHFNSKIIRFQFMQNNKQRKYFKSLKLANVIVLDHRSLLPFFQRRLMRIKFYSTLLKDAVHFKMPYYRAMSDKIVKKYLGI